MGAQIFKKIMESNMLSFFSTPAHPYFELNKSNSYTPIRFIYDQF